MVGRGCFFFGDQGEPGLHAGLVPPGPPPGGAVFLPMQPACHRLPTRPPPLRTSTKPAQGDAPSDTACAGHLQRCPILGAIESCVPLCRLSLAHLARVRSRGHGRAAVRCARGLGRGGAERGRARGKAVAWRLRGEGRGSSRETKGAMRCLTCLKRFLMTTSWTRRTS